MGQQQNVDYVLFGSITMLGTMISTDAQLVGVALEKPLLTFNEVGQDQGDIIAHMEHLTTRINETVFGVAKGVVLSPASDPAADDIHTHPEKLVIPGITPETPPAPAPSTAPAKSMLPHHRGTHLDRTSNVDRPTHQRAHNNGSRGSHRGCGTPNRRG